MNNVNKQLVTLNQDIAGQEIGIPVYRITPAIAGDYPVVYVQSAVHAAEMQGSAVIYQLIKQLQHLPIKAEFVLVPNCNPFGRTQRAGEYLQGRFDATNGNNWNRFYYYQAEVIKTFAGQLKGVEITNVQQQIIKPFKQFLQQQIAANCRSDWGVNTAQFLNGQLQQMAVQADYILDLHTGPSSTRHIYSPEYLADDAQLFNIENIISIPVSFAGALDEASFTPWYELEALLAAQGQIFNLRKHAFTIELGSQENICLQQAQSDSEGILNYLLAKSLINDFEAIKCCPSKTTLLKDYKTLFSQHAGMMEYLAVPGEVVEKGQVIARVLNSLEFDSDKAITEIRSPASGTVILHYPSAAVQVGTQIYKIAVEQY